MQSYFVEFFPCAVLERHPTGDLCSSSTAHHPHCGLSVDRHGAAASFSAPFSSSSSMNGCPECGEGVKRNGRGTSSSFAADAPWCCHRVRSPPPLCALPGVFRFHVSPSTPMWVVRQQALHTLRGEERAEGSVGERGAEWEDPRRSPSSRSCPPIPNGMGRREAYLQIFAHVCEETVNRNQTTKKKKKDGKGRWGGGGSASSPSRVGRALHAHRECGGVLVPLPLPHWDAVDETHPRAMPSYPFTPHKNREGATRPQTMEMTTTTPTKTPKKKEEKAEGVVGEDTHESDHPPSHRFEKGSAVAEDPLVENTAPHTPLSSFSLLFPAASAMADWTVEACYHTLSCHSSFFRSPSCTRVASSAVVAAADVSDAGFQAPKRPHEKERGRSDAQAAVAARPSPTVLRLYYHYAGASSPLVGGGDVAQRTPSKGEKGWRRRAGMSPSCPVVPQERTVDALPHPWEGKRPHRGVLTHFFFSSLWKPWRRRQRRSLQWKDSCRSGEAMGSDSSTWDSTTPTTFCGCCHTGEGWRHRLHPVSPPPAAFGCCICVSFLSGLPALLCFCCCSDDLDVIDDKQVKEEDRYATRREERRKKRAESDNTGIPLPSLPTSPPPTVSSSPTVGE